jgi:predicted HAD superfamily Cof-like phosphohydrolase
MEKQILQVGEFQSAFGIESPNNPKMLTKKRAALRQSLLQEEVDELKNAKNILDVADAITDCMYILIGTAHEYGMADRMVMLFDEVHRSNMSKFDENGKAVFRKDGKVLKPDTYTPPKLQPILDRDWTVYKGNEILEEIAHIEKKNTEKKIQKKISSNLNIIDRALFWLYDKVESRLNKRVEVVFPATIHDKIVVKVYGKTHEI